MRIVQITPGTASFYCGSCIRDNALVKELRGQGHDAVMVPLYLPHLTDEDPAAEGVPLFFGGINVYLQQKIPIFRKTPRWIDKLFDSEALLRMSAKKAAMTKASELGEMTLSSLMGREGSQAKELNRLIEWLRSIPAPDVISFSNAMLMGMAADIKRELKIPAVCSLQGEDGFMDALPPPYREQCWERLAKCAAEMDALIPVSHYYGNVMVDRLGLNPKRVRVVQNGIALDGYGRRPAHPERPAVGYLARMCDFKGLHRLVDAFIELKKDPANKDAVLRAAGSVTGADEPYVEEQKRKLRAAGLDDSYEFLPNISREAKIDFLRSLSVLSVPALYGESFGLYVIEAMAAGVPVVQPRSAGFTEIVEATGGGLLYDHHDPNDYARSLDRLLGDAEYARSLGAAGRKAVFERFTVERMAREIVEVFESVANPPAAA